MTKTKESYWDHVVDFSIKAAKKFGDKSPIQVRMHVGMIYIENMSQDIVDIEIKDQYGDYGWLYTDQGLLHYRIDDVRYFVKMSELRSLCEKVFTTPVARDPKSPKTHGSVTLDGRSLTGHMSFKEIHKLSFIP